MRTRTLISILVYLPTAAVLFGAGAIPVLSVPMLNAHADSLLPIVIAGSILLSIPVAWYLAPRLRLAHGARKLKPAKTE